MDRSILKRSFRYEIEWFICATELPNTWIVYCEIHNIKYSKYFHTFEKSICHNAIDELCNQYNLYKCEPLGNIFRLHITINMLPPELIIIISQYLKMVELFHLSLCSTYLYDIIRSNMFENWSIGRSFVNVLVNSLQQNNTTIHYMSKTSNMGLTLQSFIFELISDPNRKILIYIEKLEKEYKYYKDIITRDVSYMEDKILAAANMRLHEFNNHRTLKPKVVDSVETLQSEPIAEDQLYENKSIFFCGPTQPNSTYATFIRNRLFDVMIIPPCSKGPFGDRLYGKVHRLIIKESPPHLNIRKALLFTNIKIITLDLIMKLDNLDKTVFIIDEDIELLRKARTNVIFSKYNRHINNITCETLCIYGKGPFAKSVIHSIQWKDIKNLYIKDSILFDMITDTINKNDIIVSLYSVFRKYNEWLQY